MGVWNIESGWKLFLFINSFGWVFEVVSTSNRMKGQFVMPCNAQSNYRLKLWEEFGIRMSLVDILQKCKNQGDTLLLDSIVMS